MNYLVVLFKNKLKKRIINKFITYKKSKSFFDEKLKKSDSVIFETLFENGKKCEYEIGIVSTSNNKSHPTYITDNMGRNIRVSLENNNMSIVEIRTYKKEELLFDITRKIKVSSKEIIDSYLSSNNLKLIYSLNNKIIIQNEDVINIFSLKSEEESFRFLDCINNYFIKENRSDCMIIKDNSTAQRKYLLSLLSKKGYDKKMLYRKYTTTPKP